MSYEQLCKQFYTFTGVVYKHVILCEPARAGQSLDKNFVLISVELRAPWT